MLLEIVSRNLGCILSLHRFGRPRATKPRILTLGLAQEEARLTIAPAGSLDPLAARGWPSTSCPATKLGIRCYALRKVTLSHRLLLRAESVEVNGIDQTDGRVTLQIRSASKQMGIPVELVTL